MGTIIRGGIVGQKPRDPPPGGIAGVAQQTPASQIATFAPFMRSSSRGMTRRKTSSKRASSRRAGSRVKTRRTKRGKRAHLVKGSMAAKRYMAKLRRKQKRKR